MSLEPNNERLIEKAQKQLDIISKLMKVNNDQNDNLEE